VQNSIFKIKQSYFIQIADFVGTLGYIFDENKKSEHSSDFQICFDKIKFKFLPKMIIRSKNLEKTDNTINIASVCHQRKNFS
jgi:hypothetical protein